MLPHVHITLSELQRLVKETLHERFALPVWVSAEISEVKVNYSGHCYLELVEKGGDNGVPLAQSRAVIWRTAYSRIAGYFEAETGQRLAAGIKILAKVAVNYHELYGFSLQITDIDPAYTLGDMQRQRQQTIDCLRKEGVWDMNREVGMPAVVQRIAIVSSANAAGYQDFCKEIGKSPYRFRLTLFDAFMQGAAAEESIVAALCAVADRMEEFDAVVIIRGGGSASDLNCFNAYRLCTHVAQFPLPVLTGIGHDKDTSVADMVAHTALKTPTAVAGWLVERMDTIDAWLDNAALQLRDNVLVSSRTQELRLQELSSHLLFHAKGLLRQRGMALEQMRETLAASAGNFLARQTSRLGNAAELVAGRSPERILRLGFAIVRTDGKAVFSAAQVGKGDTLDIEVADGRIEGTVQYTETKCPRHERGHPFPDRVLRAVPQVHARAGGTRAPARCTRQRAVHPCGRQGGHRSLCRTRQDRARLFRRTAYESLLGRIRHGRKYTPAFLGDTRRGFPLRRPDFGRHPAVIPCRNDTYGTPGSLCPGTAVHFGQSVHHPRRGRPSTPEKVLPRQIDLRPPLAADRHEMYHACGQPFFRPAPAAEERQPVDCDYGSYARFHLRLPRCTPGVYPCISVQPCSR